MIDYNYKICILSNLTLFVFQAIYYNAFQVSKWKSYVTKVAIQKIKINFLFKNLKKKKKRIRIHFLNTSKEILVLSPLWGFTTPSEEDVLKIWLAKTIKGESDDVAVMNALWGNGVPLIVQRVSPSSHFLVLLRSLRIFPPSSSSRPPQYRV